MTTTLPIDSRRGRHCELRVTHTVTDEKPYAIGLFPIGGEQGICIGVGLSMLSALGDALDTLQAGRWSLHDAIGDEGRRRVALPQGDGDPGGPYPGGGRGSGA
jgi:hypothetical protein